MIQRLDAIFENGVFRPTQLPQLPDGQRVLLNVETQPAAADDLQDIKDLLDLDFMEACRQQNGAAPPLAAIQAKLSHFSGNLSDRIVEERDER